MFLKFLILGISLGSIYALIALGYTMVYGIIKLINFAHASIIMIGAYVGYFVLTAFGTGISGLMLAFMASMIFCACLGVTVERLCYKPLRKQPRLNVLITAMGVSMVLENGARTLPFIGTNPKPYPSLSSDTLSGLNHLSVAIQESTGLFVSSVQLLVIIVSILLMIVLQYVVRKTRVGKAMRAVSYDNVASDLIGIPVNRIISLTFLIGTGLAGAAGILYSLSFPQISPYMGTMPGLKCFIAAVFGGIGSVPGAMLGGLLIGILESFVKGYISSMWSDGIVFSVLIIILLVRPNGIMGEMNVDKV